MEMGDDDEGDTFFINISVPASRRGFQLNLCTTYVVDL